MASDYYIYNLKTNENNFICKMKQNFTKQCGFMLLLMLFAFLQTAFADKQELSFTPNDKSFSSTTNDYTVMAGTAYFSRPSVTVEDSKGNPIRSKFKLIWTVDNSDGSTPRIH